MFCCHQTLKDSKFDAVVAVKMLTKNISQQKKSEYTQCVFTCWNSTIKTLERKGLQTVKVNEKRHQSDLTDIAIGT